MHWMPLVGAHHLLIAEVIMQKWGVKLVRYKGGGTREAQEFNMWVYDDKGRFETDDFVAAAKVKQEYENKNPGGFYVVEEVKEETNV